MAKSPHELASHPLSECFSFYFFLGLLLFSQYGLLAVSQRLWAHFWIGILFHLLVICIYLLAISQSFCSNLTFSITVLFKNLKYLPRYSTKMFLILFILFFFFSSPITPSLSGILDNLLTTFSSKHNHLCMSRLWEYVFDLW